MEEVDQLVLRVTIGVSLTFPPLLIESTRLFFVLFILFLFYCVSIFVLSLFFYFLFYVTVSFSEDLQTVRSDCFETA